MTHNAIVPTDTATLAWQGALPLWRVFWLYNIAIYTVVAIALEMFAASIGLRWFVEVLFGIPYALWSLVALWRCAYNTKWAIWGHAARVWTLLTAFGLWKFFFGESVI